MSKKMQFDREDYLKVNRKLSREEEIKTHGRPVRIGGVHKSKKVYDRKRSKAEDEKGSALFFTCYSTVDFCFGDRKTVRFRYIYLYVCEKGIG